jgi:hypothetical protein
LLDDAERVERVRGAAQRAVGDSIGRGGDDGSGISIYGKIVRCPMHVGEVLWRERYVVWNCELELFGIVFTEEDWVGQHADLCIVELICSFDIEGILCVQGDAEVVVEFHADLTCAFDLVVIEVPKACMAFDYSVDGCASVDAGDGFVDTANDVSRDISTHGAEIQETHVTQIGTRSAK